MGGIGSVLGIEDIMSKDFIGKRIMVFNLYIGSYCI